MYYATLSNVAEAATAAAAAVVVVTAGAAIVGSILFCAGTAIPRIFLTQRKHMKIIGLLLRVTTKLRI